MGEHTDHQVRWQTLFSGNVQGVGFRYTTTRVAERFKVTGYVRNLPDGRVEVVSEASPDEQERFVKAVESAMQGYVRDRETQQMPAKSEFTEFGVRH
jgi:acylphosphatase